MEDDPFFDDDFTQTRRSRKRSHDQMLRDLREGSGTNRSCFTTLPRHAPSASLNQNFPPPPISRYAGDGIDGRWPAMSRSMPPNADIIDLTGDPDITPDRHLLSRNSVNTTQNPRRETTRQDIIDLAYLEDLDDDDGSSDIEIVGSNTIYNTTPPPPPPPPPPRPFQSRLPSFGRPSFHLEEPPLSGWTTSFPVGVLQRLPPFMRPQIARQTDRLRVPPPARAGGLGDVYHFRPTGFQLPDLNFDTPAFQIRPPDPPRPPTAPTYTAPSPVAEGFTRTLREEDVAICPNCDAELGVGEDEVQKQIWVIKSCGHVYCGQCAKNRFKKSAKNSRDAKPFAKCVVDGCGKAKITSAKAMIQLYI